MSAPALQDRKILHSVKPDVDPPACVRCGMLVPPATKTDVHFWVYTFSFESNVGDTRVRHYVPCGTPEAHILEVMES